MIKIYEVWLYSLHSIISQYYKKHKLNLGLYKGI